MEKLDSAEKHLKDLEGKVAKKKASESQVNDARKARDDAANELEAFKEATLRTALTKLTKAYCDMYYNSLQHMNAQLNALGGNTMQPMHPMGNAPIDYNAQHRQLPMPPRERTPSNPPALYPQ